MARNYGEHGQCEATARTTGERCEQPAVGEHGKCHWHGGASPKGREQPQFRHGLFSDHLGEEERRVMDALGDMDVEEKLAELADWRLARLRRAQAALNANDDVDADTFWDAFAEVVAKTGDVGADEIHELANMIARGNRAMQDEVDLVRKLLRDVDRIRDGDGPEAADAWLRFIDRGED